MCNRFRPLILWRRQIRNHAGRSDHEKREKYLDVVDGGIEVAGVFFIAAARSCC